VAGSTYVDGRNEDNDREERHETKGENGLHSPYYTLVQTE